MCIFNEETDLSELGEVVLAAEGALPEVLLSLAAGRSLVQLLLLRPHVVEPEKYTNICEIFSQCPPTSVMDPESGSALVWLSWIRIRTGTADPGRSKEITEAQN